MVAVRPVGERTAATEALADELAVDAGVDQVARRRDLRARRAPRKIAARIRRRRIELQRREREVVEAGHASTLSAGSGVHTPCRRSAVYQRGETLRKQPPRNRPGAEGRQVRGLLLAVDQREPTRTQYARRGGRARPSRRRSRARTSIRRRTCGRARRRRDRRRGGRRATPRPNARSRARASRSTRRSSMA